MSITTQQRNPSAMWMTLKTVKTNERGQIQMTKCSKFPSTWASRKAKWYRNSQSELTEVFGCCLFCFFCFGAIYVDFQGFSPGSGSVLRDLLVLPHRPYGISDIEPGLACAKQEPSYPLCLALWSQMVEG